MLMALVMCLSLCACGKSEAVKNAESLIDAIGEVTVDSEAAVAAAEEAYNALTEKEKAKVENTSTLEAARDALDAELFRQSFLGEWVNIDTSAKISFDETGNGISDTMDFTYEIDGNTIQATIMGTEYKFYIEEDSDGILHLKADNFKMDCVREENFSHFQPDAVEITTENWSAYFEIRECTSYYKNAFGEYVDVSTGFGIFLKDEYLERLSQNTALYPSSASFEVQYNCLYKIYSIDKDTGEYHFSEESYFPEVSGLRTTILDARDRRTLDSEEESSGMEIGPTEAEAVFWDGSVGEYAEDYMYNHFGAYLLEGRNPPDATLKDYYETPEVLRATGTIYLNK